jgi:cyclophilin family peptidyl-prolyl cis-trans isomerase
MANSGPNTNGSQVQFCAAPFPADNLLRAWTRDLHSEKSMH